MSNFNKLSKSPESHIIVGQPIIPDSSMTPATGKVALLTPWNQECGLAIYARSIINHYPKNSFLVLAEQCPTLTAPDEEFVMRCWKQGQGNYNLLEHIILKEQISLLHINANHKFFTFPHFAESLGRLRQAGVRIVLSLRAAFTLDLQLRQLLNAVDFIFVPSAEVRLEVIANGAIPENVAVLPSGVEIQPKIDNEQKNAIRRELELPVDEKIVITPGFVQPHKGIESLLRSIKALRDSGIAARGVVAGKPTPEDPASQPYQDHLKQMAIELNIENHITFMDRFLTDEEVTKYMQVADLVLMNYQSDYYEPSAACARALGAGALVAASSAPALAVFGDAVWHLTHGYPDDASAWLLLSNDNLRQEIERCRQQYCEKHAWPNIVETIFAKYMELGVKPAPNVMSSTLVDQQATVRVLMQNRPNALQQPGGDTVVMKRTIEELEKLGVEVVLDLEGAADLNNFDLVHIYNFATPDITESYARRAHAAGKPYVVTTLSEDAPSFRNQAMYWSQFLTEYVSLGQNKHWYAQNLPNLEIVQKAKRFPNDWTVAHAAGLITNGTNESAVIKRDYGNVPVHEVYLGFDRFIQPDASIFQKAYGVKDFVLCVGRLEFRKNQLALLKALEDSELTVVLAAGGFSYDPAYAQACKNFRRRGKTIVTERLNQEMLASAYKAAKVHVLPSWYELPGLVTLEAGYYGANLVVSDCGTTKNYLKDLAWYCDPANPESILSAVNQAFNSPNKEMLANQLEQFTWSNMAKQTLEIYFKILNLNNVKEKEEEPVETKTRMSNQSLEVAIPEAIVLDGYDMAAGVTEFQEVLERGELAAKERQYNIAHELLARAEQLNPLSGRAQRARGAVYLAENMISSAKRCFEKAIKLDDQDPKAFSGLGMCYMNEKNQSEAYECFVKSLEMDRNSLVTILQLLECSYILGRFDDLVRVLQNYLVGHPADNDMRFCLAGAFFKKSDFEQAKRTCAELALTSPEHKGLDELQSAIHEAEQAKKDVSIKTEQHSSAEVETTSIPNTLLDMRIENIIAKIEDKKHKKLYEQVLVDCASVLEDGALDNVHKERIQVLQAEAWLLTGKLFEGAQAFRVILEKNPRCARALCGQGALAGTSQQWAEAKKLFTKALEFDARCDVALAGLAMCAASENNMDQAWQYYNQALTINPENMRALLGLMELGYPTGRFQEIEVAIKNYLDLHPADSQFIYSLSGCLYAQNKIDEAVDQLGRLRLIDPQHTGAEELMTIISQRESGGVGV